MSSQNVYLRDWEKIDWWKGITNVSSLVLEITKEIRNGLRFAYLPIIRIAAAGLLISGAIYLHWDYSLFSLAKIAWLYPRNPQVFKFYRLFMETIPLLIWGYRQVSLRKQRQIYFDGVFESCGLKNGKGEFPGLIFDLPHEGNVRKLKLDRKYLTHSAFLKAKPALESAMGAYIREIVEQREKGTEEIYYSHEPEPDLFEISSSDFSRSKAFQFLVGQRNGRAVTGSLKETPHLLIAGETGGGKSTFLKQLITQLYLSPGAKKLILIDLKGGLEFQFFQNLPDVSVIGDVDSSLNALLGIPKLISERMKLFKENNCKDIDQYQKLCEQDERPKLDRRIIVIDEAGELYLGKARTSDDSFKLRDILSNIARTGRSLGIHLIIATQRPDSKALDAQVKANCTGVLCFKMVNDASSISVLGNGKATDLPSIPGRAIWKMGTEFLEVQTPYLSQENMEECLASYRKETPTLTAENSSERMLPLN